MTTRAARRGPVRAIYADYERQKQRNKRVDFEDMLALTVELLESDAGAAKTGPVAARAPPQPSSP